MSTHLLIHFPGRRAPSIPPAVYQEPPVIIWAGPADARAAVDLPAFAAAHIDELAAREYLWIRAERRPLAVL